MSNVFDDIEHRLAGAAQAMRERDVTGQRLADLTARRAGLETELAGVRDKASAERKDVERLEGLSLTHLLASIKGSLDERLAWERAEAEAARYRAAEVQARLETVRAAERAARERLDQLATAPDDFAAALDAKERYISAAGDPRGGALLSLAQQRGHLSGELTETQEALGAAAAALNALSDVQDRLGSAAGWSTYDTWFGGGAIASSVKHSRLDEAAQAAAAADQRLAVLRSELADVGDPGLTAPQLAMSGGMRFADVWFDNFFTDIAVADRIKQAQQSVAQIMQAVGQLGARLRARQQQAESELSGIETERQRLLTS